MSGSKEKTKRNVEKEQGLDKRERELLEEKKQNKKTRTLAIAIVLIVVVLLAIALLVNSNFLRRNATAIKIGDTKFTVADFDFHYYNNYYDYLTYVYSYQSDYASVLLPESGKPLDSQSYDENRTWKDYFQEYALKNLTRQVALYNEGHEVGFEMSEEDIAALNEELNKMETSATAAGYASVDKYIAAYYGKSVTYEILKKNLEYITYAEKYEEYYKNSLTYTDEEIDAQYNAKKEMYDKYHFRYIMVFSDKVDEEAYDNEDDLQAAKDAAAAVAHDKAEAYASRIKAGESIIDIAREYDSEKYAEDDSTLRDYNGDVLGSTYGPWLRDDARKSGDVGTFDISTGTYVVQYEGRDDNHYETVNMRSVAIVPDTVNASDYENEENDDAYNAAVEEAKNNAKKKAEDLYQEWKDNGGGEDEFAQMAIDNSGDSQASEGGLWENVYDGQYSSAINSWLYDKSRKEGDTTVIYSEDAGAYFILYFKGYGELYAEYLAETDLRNTDINAWDEALTADLTASKTWMYSLA